MSASHDLARILTSPKTDARLLAAVVVLIVVAVLGRWLKALIGLVFCLAVLVAATKIIG